MATKTTKKKTKAKIELESKIKESIKVLQKNNYTVFENGNGIYCRKCQEFKSPDKFYETTNTLLDTNNKMSVCKDCCNDIYFNYYNTNNNIKKSLQLTCEDLDVCFNSDALNQMESHIESLKNKGSEVKTPFGYYKSKLSSTAKSNGLTSFRYKDSDLIKDKMTDKERFYVDIEDYDTVEVAYLKSKWGNLSDDDLKFLEEKYNEWDSGFEISGKNREIVVQQICFEELFIFKERQEGKDVSKRIKNIRDLMGTGNLSPKQESASETAEFQTLSEFIKKVETGKPFVKDGYDDVDGMNKMWQSLAGAINRTQGKPDEFTQIFDEVYKDYTMDLGNVEGDNNA